MFTFEEIIGYEGIKEHIQHSLQLGRLSHAYIIDGPEGSGKKLIAGTMAKTLQCEAGGQTPCNTCISCMTFDSENHPDVIYVKPTKKKSIGIEDIRKQIGETIDLKPYKYEYKIYIIDQADILTEQAQNALLKTIEEPPEYAMIILLSKNINAFLPTILSRCVVLTLRPLQKELIRKFLIAEEGIPDYQADVYTSFANGTIGMAKQLAGSEAFVEMRNEILGLLQGLRGYNRIETMENYKTLEKYKDKIQQVLHLMYIWYRDLMVVKEDLDESYVMNKDHLSKLESESGYLSLKKITDNLEAIEKTKQSLRRNANFQLVMEMMLLKLK